jgi:hypothetical protein
MAHKRAAGRVPSQLRVREEMPKMTSTKEGAVIWCPFCVPSHAITPGQASPCGTQLKLTAVQTVIPARVARMQKIVCLKCHETGEGDLVPYMKGFIHLIDCKPDTNLLRTTPEFSRAAEWVFKLPVGLRARVCRVTGYPQQVREIDPDGKETGKIIGYFFLRGNANATRTPAQPTA